MAFATAGMAFRQTFLAIALLGLCACQSATIEDVVPQARNTGTFPNLNVVPKPETTQLTEAEKNAKMAELQAAKASVSNSAASSSAAASEAELRRIAQTHATDTLKEIEAD